MSKRPTPDTSSISRSRVVQNLVLLDSNASHLVVNLDQDLPSSPFSWSVEILSKIYVQPRPIRSKVLTLHFEIVKEVKQKQEQL